MGSDTALLFIGGVNIEITQGLFLKLEFDHIETQKNNADFGGDDYTEFKGAVAVGF